jgi:hypothetical protein
MLLSMLGLFSQVQKSLLLVFGVGRSEVRKKGAEQIEPHQQLGSTFARVLESERERELLLNSKQASMIMPVVFI